MAVQSSALVVDDNATNLRILRLQLQGWAMSCVCATDPADALALVAAGARHDLTVIGMDMPGMNGQQLAAELKRQPGGRALPVMLLSSIGGLPGRGGQCSARPSFRSWRGPRRRGGGFAWPIRRSARAAPCRPGESPSTPWSRSAACSGSAAPLYTGRCATSRVRESRRVAGHRQLRRRQRCDRAGGAAGDSSADSGGAGGGRR